MELLFKNSMHISKIALEVKLDLRLELMTMMILLLGMLCSMVFPIANKVKKSLSTLKY